MPPDGRDATQLLGEAHHEIRSLLKQTAASRGERRVLDCHRLRLTLAAHEAAEDIAIHPRTRRLASQQCCLDRLAEERQVQNLVAALERLSPDSDGFQRYLTALTGHLDRHLVAEETYEFPGIEQIRDPREVAAMVRVLNAARFITASTGVLTPTGGYATMLHWAHTRLARLVQPEPTPLPAPASAPSHSPAPGHAPAPIHHTSAAIHASQHVPHRTPLAAP